VTVRRLDPVLVDRIAAGEVVERPASAVKELVENALDAGASRIEVVVENGGRTLIRVVDDGLGMTPEDLELAVERHATSKIPDGDLFRIETLGFRGEALPSIGAVARLSITTRRAGADHASAILVDAGIKHPVRPAALDRGTRVEVADLFHAVPARLKFLKTDRAEAQAIGDLLKRIAMAHPRVRFTLSGDGGTVFDHPAARGVTEAEALAERLGQVLGRDFTSNALPVDAIREEAALSGLAGLATDHRATAAGIHTYVNGRPVRDKLLLGAVKAAYADLLPNGRHPAVALYLTVPPRMVDVNVHPAKSEVRFRDPGLVRGLVVGALKQTLGAAGHRAANTVGARTLDALRPGVSPQGGVSGMARPLNWDWRTSPAAPSAAETASAPFGFAEAAQAAIAAFAPQSDTRATETPIDPGLLDRPLGAARAQLHDTYIVAQTRDGVVIVDQHAAHERLVYERLKRERDARGIERQMLLIPVVVDLDPVEADRLLERAAMLASSGLVIESFGPGAVAVSEVPSALAGGDVPALMRDLVDGMEEWGSALALEDRLDHVLATFACHHSVRAGRRMKPEEMNALLREMEATPFSGQCNHGRPTYVELKLVDIERLFGRR